MARRKVDWSGLEDFRKTLPEYRRQEYYRFLTLTWDIVKVQYLLERYPREPFRINVKQFADNHGFSFISGGLQEGQTLPEQTGFFYVDTKAAMSEQVDLSRFLIIAQVKLPKGGGGTILIDGLHRVFKAAIQGVPELMAYVLTPEEERICRA